MVRDSQLKSAIRRRNTLLADETYGPKLARLNKRDASRIDDLIFQNRGADARAELLRLDRERRAQVRARPSRARRVLTIGAARERLYRRLEAHFGQRVVATKYGFENKFASLTVSRRIDRMTETQVYDALKLTDAQLDSAVKQNPPPPRWAQEDNSEYNVLWYHAGGLAA